MVRVVQALDRIDWDFVAAQLPGRSSRQCRERWVNYLSPYIRHDPWNEKEDRELVEKVNEVGHSWSTIGKCFNGRSENDVKNRWYSHLKFRTTLVNGKYRLLTTGELKAQAGTRGTENRHTDVERREGMTAPLPPQTSEVKPAVESVKGPKLPRVLDLNTETEDIWTWLTDDCPNLKWDI